MALSTTRSHSLASGPIVFAGSSAGAGTKPTRITPKAIAAKLAHRERCIGVFSGSGEIDLQATAPASANAMPRAFLEVLAEWARAAWRTIDQGWRLNGRQTQSEQLRVGMTPTSERVHHVQHDLFLLGLRALMLVPHALE